MLKWTVSKRTDVASHSVADTTYFAEPTSRHPRDRRRRSKENHDPQQPQQHHQHHHHQIATPLPLTMRQLIATSTPYGSQEALCMLGSNGNSLTTTLTSTPSPLRKRKQSPADGGALPSSNRAYASTLPTFGVEYSPMPRPQRSGQSIALRGLTIPDSFFGNARYFPTNASSSSATTVDGPPALKRRKVIANAILDCPPPMPCNQNSSSTITEAQRSQRMAEYVDEEADLNLSSKALDDAELGRMIDDILQSKRKPTTDRRQPPTRTPTTCSALADEDFAFISHKPIQPPSCHQHQQGSPPQTVIAPHLYNEHPFLRESIELLAGMSTPKDTRTIDDVDSAQPVLRQRSASSGANTKRSPPTTATAQTTATTTAGTPVRPEQIRRCLTFAESPETTASWQEKRNSVASTISTTSTRCSTNLVSGVLNLSIRANASEIEVHIIRCKDLVRSNGGTVNAYVKVARLAEVPSGPAAASIRFQRTRVHRDSAEPFFNHRFIFDRPATMTAVLSERIQLTVWHRDRESKRSEFLGCLAFPMHAILSSNVFGAFALQPQSSLDEAVAIAVTPVDVVEATSTAQRPPNLPERVMQSHDRVLSTTTNDKPSNRQINDIMSYLDKQNVAQMCDRRGRNVESATFKHSLCVR